MAMYDWQELLARWEQEKLTAEQAIGQLLQWGQEATRTFARQAQLERLKHRVAELANLSTLNCVYFTLLVVGVVYAVVILIAGGRSAYMACWTSRVAVGL